MHTSAFAASGLVPILTLRFSPDSTIDRGLLVRGQQDSSSYGRKNVSPAIKSVLLVSAARARLLTLARLQTRSPRHVRGYLKLRPPQQNNYFRSRSGSGTAQNGVLLLRLALRHSVRSLKERSEK